MCGTLVHRGPDDEGVHTAPHVGLGQRRLSIIDLRPEAAPPLSNEDGSLWVVYNGEIYNFQEERKELVAKGHLFRTDTDTEVLLHLYEEYGTDCLSRLRGMFAFALWDSRRKTLFAARDRFGKKPFFYAKTPSSFLFGSAIKAIAEDPTIVLSPDYAAIDRYLTWQYVPSPLTAFSGIRKLPPAHFLTCRADGTVAIQRYWTPFHGTKTAASPREIEEELIRRLAEAVRCRMISDVPLGAFLSGGIDSATIVALMARESGRPVKTFSIGFEEETHNELPFARKVAQRYGTDHHEFIVKPDAAEVLPLLVRHFSEPFADSSALPTYYVSKVTREHVTVALSGDGGDESFSGYDRYGEILRWSRTDIVPYPARHAVGACMGGLLDRMPYSNGRARASRGFRMLGSRLRERYLLHMTMLKRQEKRASYTPRFLDRIASGAAGDDPVAGLPWDASMDPLDWMMRHDQHFYLPDCLMVKSDVASMANSLEVRCPFLDHRLAEFAATIPSGMKRDTAGGKRILKRAVKDLLPPEILTKPKTGFGIPLAKWFRGELSDLLRGTLLDERASRRGLLDGRFVKKMVDEQIDGRRDWSNRLWAFLVLELWFREFID
jgi:asparagine synthase (glutamine-hydrolysing)